ncbi:hypothetical protein E2P81_ATG08295 [Venturia nashicola]|nr:hypothetical protein E2P81_ATG08295 [Venturia nashicola]
MEGADNPITPSCKKSAGATSALLCALEHAVQAGTPRGLQPDKSGEYNGTGLGCMGRAETVTPAESDWPCNQDSRISHGQGNGAIAVGNTRPRRYAQPTWQSWLGSRGLAVVAWQSWLGSRGLAIVASSVLATAAAAPSVGIAGVGAGPGPGLCFEQTDTMQPP